MDVLMTVLLDACMYASILSWRTHGCQEHGMIQLQDKWADWHIAITISTVISTSTILITTIAIAAATLPNATAATIKYLSSWCMVDVGQMTIFVVLQNNICQTQTIT